MVVLGGLGNNREQIRSKIIKQSKSIVKKYFYYKNKFYLKRYYSTNSHLKLKQTNEKNINLPLI